MNSREQTSTRHFISINDLSDAEIERVFHVAEQLLERFGDKERHYRIARSADLATAFISASLFYEPSTRTRLSFETAMLRLGGRTITSADPSTSSAAKGESLADTVRVLSNYADLIVIRHPRDGAARLAADYASVPVINGGDGSHEHPTQTLCDLFTLRRERGGLRNLKVAISGDLKGSRTVHSFVYALARFGADIQELPAPGMELPRHVADRLQREFGCQIVPASRRGKDAMSFDALYVTPDEPHQPSLFAEPDVDLALRVLQKKFDAIYVTRFQKERWSGEDLPYTKVDKEFLQSPEYSHASVLHPLPRVGELDSALDSDERAKYFQQAAYGVPIRMALISLLLGLPGTKPFERHAGGFDGARHPGYRQPRGVGIQCGNANCITNEKSEQPYVENRFFIVSSDPSRPYSLRCAYCESDVSEFVVGHRKHHWYSTDLQSLEKPTAKSLKDYVFFAGEAQAQNAGFHSHKVAAAKPKSRGGAA